jgi:hypothetical protein
VHVARRVEEVHAAEARLHVLGQRLRQRVDRQPEVLLATIASGAMNGAIFEYRSRFQSMRSAIASMIRSQLAQQLEVLVVVAATISAPRPCRERAGESFAGWRAP